MDVKILKNNTILKERQDVEENKSKGCVVLAVWRNRRGVLPQKNAQYCYGPLKVQWLHESLEKIANTMVDQPRLYEALNWS